MDPISLTVPARSEFVSLARTVVANAAAHLKMTFDQVDDLRLAADEAVSQLIQLPGASTLNLQIQLSQDSIEIRSWVDAQPTDWPPAELDGSLTWQILADWSRRPPSKGTERTRRSVSALPQRLPHEPRHRCHRREGGRTLR